MANSLHFERDKVKVLRLVWDYLTPGGRLLLVEYNSDLGNPWVPHPVSFERFQALAPEAGFQEPRLLERVPSRFLREIYSALALKPGWRSANGAPRAAAGADIPVRR